MPSGKAKKFKNRNDSKKQSQFSTASEEAGGKASKVKIPNPVVKSCFFFFFAQNRLGFDKIFVQQVPSGKAMKIPNRDDSKKQTSASQSQFSAASEGAGGKTSEVSQT